MIMFDNKKKSIKLGVQFIFSTILCGQHSPFHKKKKYYVLQKDDMRMNGKKDTVKNMCKSFIIKSYNKDFSFELQEVISLLDFFLISYLMYCVFSHTKDFPVNL
jgi:hypothetical protein